MSEVKASHMRLLATRAARSSLAFTSASQPVPDPLPKHSFAQSLRTHLPSLPLRASSASTAAARVLLSVPTPTELASAEASLSARARSERSRQSRVLPPSPRTSTHKVPQEWAMLSALEAHENKIAQQRELSHKRESQRSASAALASQVGERRRSISSRFAANEAEHAQVLVNQANAAAREQVEAAIRAAKAADLAKSIQQQQAQNAAFKARSKAEDREFERQSAAALKAAVEADRIEQERLKKAAEVQALAAHQENVRLKQQRTQAIKQAAKDDQELIRKWNETLDAQEAQRKKSIAEMEAKMVHKAAVGFKTAATVDERAKQDEERALRDQRAKDQAERERERAKLQAAADSKAEMLQSLNAQMAERRERRKQQFADHHDIVQQQKQLQKQVKLEAEAAKAQRQQAKSNYKQALDLQVALHPQQVMSQLTSKNSNKAPLVGTEVMSAAEKAMNAARLERARVFQAELSQQQQQHVEANKRLPQSELRWPASRQDEQARARG